MKINIKGYKNLNDCELEITENKINLIFGLSGSGKSSISNALQRLNLDENCTIGFRGEQIVTVDDNPDFSEVVAFERDAIDDFILIRDSNRIQSVLVENPGEFTKAEKELNRQLKELIDAVELNKAQYDFLKLVKNELGSNLTKAGDVKASSRIISLEKSIEKTKSKKVWDRIVSMPSGKFGWIKEGEKFLKSDICPYCDHRIPKKQQSIIDKTNSFERKTIDAVLSVQDNPHNNIVDDASFSKGGISRLKSDIIRAIQAVDAYEELLKYIDVVQEQKLDTSTKGVNCVDNLQYYFPNLYEIVLKYNDTRSRLERISETLRKNTKKILSGRLKKINEYLAELSMPFHIEAEYAKGRINNYIICYNNDADKKDRPQALSEGEKCILAQLMFIFQCKKDDKKLIIIDDPASAFDDYRRSQMLNIVRNELAGRTVLILSHDSTYAKYLVADKQKRGRVLYIENFEEKVNLREVSVEDFGEFNDYVISRINQSKDYYKKILNLRLLYEGSHGSYAYKYLSAIIHKTPRDELIILLDEKGITEDHIIELIIQKYPDLSEPGIPKYDDEIKVDISEYSFFEKAFWLREHLDKKEKRFKSELNDYAHINRYLKVCLNPYEFNFCTRDFYKFVQEHTTTDRGNKTNDTINFR